MVCHMTGSSFSIVINTTDNSTRHSGGPHTVTHTVNLNDMEISG